MAGQIINRGKNTWYLRVYLGVDPLTGKRQYRNKTVHGRKADAKAVLLQMLTARDAPISGKVLFSDHLDEWLEEVSIRVKTSTAANYVQVLDARILPVFGMLRLEELTPDLVRKFLAKLTQDGYSPRYVRYVIGLLRNCLQHAVERGNLIRNPVDGVTLPRRKPREIPTITPELIQRLIREAGKQEGARLNKCFVALLAATGLRPSEAVGLQWRDFDPTVGTVKVQRVIERIGNGVDWEISEPKTLSSRRSIYLPPFVTKLLLEKQRHSNPSIPWIFAGENGDPINHKNFARSEFTRIKHAAGVDPKFRLYDLRHACATLLLMAGEHPKVVADRLGHSSITVTLDNYSHVMPEMRAQSSAKLEQLLSASGENAARSALKSGS